MGLLYLCLRKYMSLQRKDMLLSKLDNLVKVRKKRRFGKLLNEEEDIRVRLERTQVCL
jgi:hypothetical protein